MEKKWLTWAKELQAIAQAGLEYSKDDFDKERFERIREISVEVVSSYTEMSHTKVRELFANESGYQTPKVDVRAAIFKDDKILMVKEKIDNRWSLPGGWADIGYSVYENIKKEALEEAGAIIQPNKVISILSKHEEYNDDYPYTVYKIFVLCDYLSNDFTENIETLDADFFSIDNLPELSIYRNTKKHIEQCFRAKLDPNHQTIFD